MMRVSNWAPVLLLALLGVVHVSQRGSGGIVGLLQRCCEGTGKPAWTLPGADLPDVSAEEDASGEGEEGSGWRWAKLRPNLQTPTYYDHPLATVRFPFPASHGEGFLVMFGGREGEGEKVGRGYEGRAQVTPATFSLLGVECG